MPETPKFKVGDKVIVHWHYPPEYGVLDSPGVVIDVDLNDEGFPFVSMGMIYRVKFDDYVRKQLPASACFSGESLRLYRNGIERANQAIKENT